MSDSDQPMEETMSVPAMAPEELAVEDLRQLADRLLETRKVEFPDDGALLLMNPPAPDHRTIVRLIVKAILLAAAREVTPIDWAINSENYQWELPDDARHFFIPDIVVTHPGARTPEAERAGIALVAEVTSPGSADTVYNDRVIKPAKYARGGVPLYLLVDQERMAWSLHGTVSAGPGYQLLAAGKYGEDVPLPAPFGFSVPTGEWPVPQPNG